MEELERDYIEINKLYDDLLERTCKALKVKNTRELVWTWGTKKEIKESNEIGGISLKTINKIIERAIKNVNRHRSI